MSIYSLLYSGFISLIFEILLFEVPSNNPMPNSLLSLQKTLELTIRIVNPHKKMLKHFIHNIA